MGAVGLIALWAALFLAGHFILSSDAVRGAIAGAVGEQPFRGIYSLVALGTFIPLIYVFGHHKHAGAMLWYLRGCRADTMAGVADDAGGADHVGRLADNSQSGGARRAG